MSPRLQQGRFLERGFRPFFLLAGLYALAAMALWLVMLLWGVGLWGPLDPLGWHAHEMLFGFATAAVAGFVLTAVPNWTGRLPLSGAPLAMMALLWLAGRVAVLSPIGVWPAAIVDVTFLVVLDLVVLREVVAGRNWRNLPVAVALAALIGANVVSWLEIAGTLPNHATGNRLGIATLILLICLIGGRIVPSFTRNWLAKRKAARLPAPFGAYDQAVLAVTLVAMVAWALRPEGPVLAAMLTAAAIGNLVRLARWCGLQTLSEPLLWILHVGYLWVPVGLGLAAGAAWEPGLVPAIGVLHAFTAGAATVMIVAVMTRATLGHAGRALTADRTTTATYVLILVAAVARVWASFDAGLYWHLLHVSGAAWIAGFALYLLRYAPIQLAITSRPTASKPSG